LYEIIDIYVDNFKDKTENIEYRTNTFKKDVKRFTEWNVEGTN